MKLLTIFSITLLGLGCVLLALGTYEAVGCPRVNINPYLSRDGSWIEMPLGFDEERLQYVGMRISREISALRLALEHTNRSNGFLFISTLCAIAGGLLALIRNRTIGQKISPKVDAPPPLQSHL